MFFSKKKKKRKKKAQRYVDEYEFGVISGSLFSRAVEELHEKFGDFIPKAHVEYMVRSIQAPIVLSIFLHRCDEIGVFNRTPFNQLKIVCDFRSLLMEDVDLVARRFVDTTLYRNYFCEMKELLFLPNEPESALEIIRKRPFGLKYFEPIIAENAFGFVNFVRDVARLLIDQLTKKAVTMIREKFSEDFATYQRVEGVSFLEDESVSHGQAQDAEEEITDSGSTDTAVAASAKTVSFNC